MEMCLAWGLAPNVVEALPRHTRLEMMAFFSWKNTREQMRREKADAEAKQRQGGWS